VLLDPGNPDFTILGRPLLNVLDAGYVFVLHGVRWCSSSNRAAARVGGRATDALACRLVRRTFLAMGLTAIGASAWSPAPRVGRRSR
jgi:hypothetical protein